MTGINTIIFDLGGVLIDWDPKYVFNETYFESIKTRDYFLNHICTLDWNEQQDAGSPIAIAVEEKVAAFPDWGKDIRAYYDRWPEMLKGPIHETVEIFRKLKQNSNLKLYALTNWSAETFPIALERFDFLHWFDGRVVSGEEKMRKPFPEFYQLLLDRYTVKPGEALFIDDNLRNVKAAKESGINSIYYLSPQQLLNDLSANDIQLK